MSDIGEIYGEDQYDVMDLQDLPYEWDTIDAHRYNLETSVDVRRELRENEGSRVDLYVHDSDTGRMRLAISDVYAGDLYRDLKESHRSMGSFIEKYTDGAMKASNIDHYFLDVKEEE